MSQVNATPSEPQRKIRILVIRPPDVLSYFNAGHHLALYQVAGYLRREYTNSVDVINGPIERLGWKDIALKLRSEKYDHIAIMNDFDGLDGFARLVDFAVKLSPGSTLSTFGRLSGVSPRLFYQFPLTYIISTGDFELGVSNAIHSRGQPDDFRGIHVNRNGVWSAPGVRGDVLPPEEWHLPDHDLIPYAAYDDLYASDARKFSGIPAKRELVVPVARGCPVGCRFCEVPEISGIKDRRLSVNDTISYIRRSFETHSFDYVSFYAPTFTLNRPWTLQLCDELIRLGSPYPWKCCTTIHHLNREIVEKMGKSGCVRISVGLETLEHAESVYIPNQKRKEESDLADLAMWCQHSNIELNCFVIIGLPGTTVLGSLKTIEKARFFGARVRPTIYTSYDRFDENTPVFEVGNVNRMLVHPAVHNLSKADSELAYDILYAPYHERTNAVTRFQREVPTL